MCNFAVMKLMKCKILPLAVALTAIPMLIVGCSRSGRSAFDSVMAPAGDLDYATYGKEYVERMSNSSMSSSKNDDETAYSENLDSLDVESAMPTERVAGYRIKINNIGPLHDVFNDSNKYQYAIAERLGIKPIRSLADAYYTRRPLIEVKSCNLYEVDTLTHSLPFLVPEAEKLLSKIGKNFIDSLHNRGADGYRVRVTSLLRTPASVKRLRRVNRNATDSSTHQFGTTFDLTYTRFYCYDSTRRVHDGDLKNLLAEVLNDLHRRGECLVKFERHTACFHITATGK